MLDPAPPPAPPIQPQPPAPVPPPQLQKESSAWSSTTQRETAEEKRIRTEQAAQRGKFERAAEEYSKPGEQDREILRQQGIANTQTAADLDAQARASAEHEKAVEEERARVLSQASAASDAAKDKYSKMEVRDYFGKGAPGEGQKAQVLFGIALSGIGNAIRGTTGNSALTQLNRMIDQHVTNEHFRIEQAYKGIQVADASKEAALHDVDARAAGVRTRLAADARASAANRGIYQNDIDKSAAVIKLQDEAAKADVARQKRALEYVDADLQHASTLRSHGTSSGTSTSQDPGLTAGGKVAEAGAGRAAGVQIQKATLAEHGQTAIDTIDRLNKEGVYLTEEDRQNIQNDRKDVEAAEHMNPQLVRVGRATVMARSPYEHLSKKKQILAQAHDVLAQKFAAIVSPSHDAKEIERNRGLADLNMPGISNEAQSQIMSNSRGVIGAAHALGGKYSGIADQGAAKGRTSAPRELPPGAIPGTNNGKAGYRLGNMFYPDDGQ